MKQNIFLVFLLFLIFSNSFGQYKYKRLAKDLQTYYGNDTINKAYLLKKGEVYKIGQKEDKNYVVFGLSGADTLGIPSKKEDFTLFDNSNETIIINIYGQRNENIIELNHQDSVNIFKVTPESELVLSTHGNKIKFNFNSNDDIFKIVFKKGKTIILPQKSIEIKLSNIEIDSDEWRVLLEEIKKNNISDTSKIKEVGETAGYKLTKSQIAKISKEINLSFFEILMPYFPYISLGAILLGALAFFRPEITRLLKRLTRKSTNSQSSDNEATSSEEPPTGEKKSEVSAMAIPDNLINTKENNFVNKQAFNDELEEVKKDFNKKIEALTEGLEALKKKEINDQQIADNIKSYAKKINEYFDYLQKNIFDKIALLKKDTQVSEEELALIQQLLAKFYESHEQQKIGSLSRISKDLTENNLITVEIIERLDISKDDVDKLKSFKRYLYLNGLDKYMSSTLILMEELRNFQLFNNSQETGFSNRIQKDFEPLVHEFVRTTKNLTEFDINYIPLLSNREDIINLKNQTPLHYLYAPINEVVEKDIIVEVKSYGFINTINIETEETFAYYKTI